MGEEMTVRARSDAEDFYLNAVTKGSYMSITGEGSHNYCWLCGENNERQRGSHCHSSCTVVVYCTLSKWYMFVSVYSVSAAFSLHFEAVCLYEPSLRRKKWSNVEKPEQQVLNSHLYTKRSAHTNSQSRGMKQTAQHITDKKKPCGIIEDN